MARSDSRVLKPPGHERLFQSAILEATFGGGEETSPVSLANYGIDASFITVLPKNELGNACLQEIRKYGVDTSKIKRGPVAAWVSISLRVAQIN